MAGTINITANGRQFRAVLQDNPAAKTLLSKLPLTIDMTDLNENEKYHYLPFRLPRNAADVKTIVNGDLMLYENNYLVIFYKDISTTYRYTPLGKIDEAAGLQAALGKGAVKVTFTRNGK